MIINDAHLRPMLHFADLLGIDNGLAENDVLTLKGLRDRAFEVDNPLIGIEVSIKFFVPKPEEII